VASDDEQVQVAFDRPLRVERALNDDQLGRRGYAESAVRALARVSSSAGFVLSVEGPWGSGKTSTLAMMEALLGRQETSPVIVHFNPWLIGDRDALLRQFLAKLAAAVKLTDHAADGKKVARELKAYGKVFDLVKLFPGAEPWASIVKSVIESTGESVDSVASYKTPDLETTKEKVADALRHFSRSIVVFVDDVDRLFPAEVFEVIRIVKAVGDLPNVGYVLAWDPEYVSDALKAANIPRAESYLDKVVQVRLPLPAISIEARGKLINSELARLHIDAHQAYFPNAQDRLGELYMSGLRDMLEQPRDFTRVFNTVSVIEPTLRGELVLADIVGLSALMVKASAVYELMRKEPRWFVGLLPEDHGLIKNNEDLLKEGSIQREKAFERCDRPTAVRALVQWMFPLKARSDDKFTMGRVVDVEGHIAAPARMLVALQMHVSGSDVSYVLARRYLVYPEKRAEICRSLSTQNCLEFLEGLGNVIESTRAAGVDDVDRLCSDLAQLADLKPFSELLRVRTGFSFQLHAEAVAFRAIRMLVEVAAPERATVLAETIVFDPYAVTVAVRLFTDSFLVERDGDAVLRCPSGARAKLATALSKNVLVAAKDGRLLNTSNPGYVLWRLPEIAAKSCPEVFAALQSIDASLDGFAMAILGSGSDSVKGRYYSLPDDHGKITAYCSIASLKQHAERRLSDPAVQFPSRAAWQSVLDGKKVYAVDGSYRQQ
jgi:hypothetical protein